MSVVIDLRARTRDQVIHYASKPNGSNEIHQIQPSFSGVLRIVLCVGFGPSV